MNRAAIDIGSNSILLTVVSADGAVVHDEVQVVGLGRGLGDRGLFAPDRMEAAAEVLASYVETAGQLGIRPWSIRAVATSAARRAMNATTFFARIQRQYGLKVSIISGEEEARLTWKGATDDLDLETQTVLVIDLGGGSTELVLGAPNAQSHRRSLEMGSVRLTEQFFPDEMVTTAQLARAQKHVDQTLQSWNPPHKPTIAVGVAGTVTSLSAIQLGLTAYDSQAIHGSKLSRAHLSGMISTLLPMSATERQAWAAISPKRADYLLAGSLILERVLTACKRPSLQVSDRGLRYGVLADRP